MDQGSRRAVEVTTANWEGLLFSCGVKVGATLAERTIIGAVAAMILGDQVALLAREVVVVNGSGTFFFQSFGGIPRA
jgi:hypothetical protein